MKFDKLYIICFLGCIFMMPILTLFKYRTTSAEFIAKNEKRKLQSFKNFSLKKAQIKQFFEAIEPALGDRLSFRQDLLKFDAFLNFGLGMREYNTDVIVGKDGWLFYRPKHLRNTRHGYKNLRDTLKLNHWNQYFNKIDRYLAKRGVVFKVIIIPDKNTLYSEYLPDHLQTTKVSILDNLLLKQKTTMVNIKKAMTQSKIAYPQRMLYSKTDTHWNLYGAYIGYEEIMRTMSENFQQNQIRLNYESFCLKKMAIKDLVKLINGQNYFDGYHYEIIDRSAFIGDYLVSYQRPEEIEVVAASRNTDLFRDAETFNDTKMGKVLYIGDSFAGALSVYLNNTFQEVIYRHYVNSRETNIDDLVETYKPDIVLFEMVERILSQPTPVFIKLTDSIVPQTIIKVDLKDIKPLKENDPALVINHESDSTLILEALNNDPMLKIAINQTYQPGQYLEIDMTSCAATSCNIYYQTYGLKGYNEDNLVSVAIGKGRQKFYIEIPPAEIKGQLRFDPGAVPGTYIIHSVKLVK